MKVRRKINNQGKCILMKSTLNAKTKEDAEFFINIYTLGILNLLLNKQISINDIEKLLFRPGVIEYLDHLSINKKYLDVLWLGTELEDIESLIPEQLNQEILKLINLSIENLNNTKLSDNISISFQIDNIS